MFEDAATYNGVQPAWPWSSLVDFADDVFNWAVHIKGKEYTRTGRVEDKDAAKNLADHLVAMQTGEAWVDVYGQDGSGTLLPSVTTSWVRNMALATLGLDTFIRQTASANPTVYANTTAQARVWFEQQTSAYQAEGGAVGGIIDGAEGNGSSYFAIHAAVGTTNAAILATFLLPLLWETKDRSLRMEGSNWRLAISVTGNCGACFLRSLRDDNHAIDGLGLVVGIFPTRSFAGSIVGLGDISSAWQPTVDFTGQYTAASEYGAAWLIEQTLLLEDPNDLGTFPGASNDFIDGMGWNTAITGTSPQPACT